MYSHLENGSYNILTIPFMLFSTTQKLYPYPNGWYVIAKSGDIKPNQVVTKAFMGEEIIVFRTEQGHISVMHAYCPHLGAHLGFGGKVIGENIKCPFHDFQFDTTGTCVKTGYDTPPPAKCRVPTWQAQERNGFVWAWHDAKNNAPDWEIPQIDWAGWSPLMTHEWTLKSHPQETSENSVDIGHFSIVHGYKSVEVLKESEIDGAFLKAKYAIHRDADFMGKKGNIIRAEFDAIVMGLGCSFVEVLIPSFGIETRNYVFARPLDGETISLTIAMSVKKIANPSKIHPLLSLVPQKWLNKLILYFTFKGYKNDVYQDFFVWENKKHIPHPALAKGDGPVGLYRRYVRQFYYADVVKEWG